MTFNEDSLQKWKDSRTPDEDGDIPGIYAYVNEMWATIDEIRASGIYKELKDISHITASGRGKNRPSSYIWIVLENRIEDLPSTINGFDVEFLIRSEMTDENTIYIK